jgi:hypothetical protein
MTRENTVQYYNTYNNETRSASANEAPPLAEEGACGL